MKLSSARFNHLHAVTLRVGLYAAIFFEGFPLQSLTVVFKMFKTGIAEAGNYKSYIINHLSKVRLRAAVAQRKTTA